MPDQLMILPASKFDYIRLLRMPDDMEEHEAYRYATGIIAEVQESEADCSWEDIADALETHGFSEVTYTLGPELRCRK
ncbi:MAG: hypothetical protein PVF75_01115 [Granulosicoccaceae bacterium]